MKIYSAATACLFVVQSVLAAETSTELKPLPAPAQTENIVPLSTAEQLGKDIFFDHTLSNPSGYSCATCHIPQSGFTGPNSLVNEISGPVSGVVPGRFGKRKPQAVRYSTFSPEGPFFNTNLQVYMGGNFWDGRAPDNAGQAKMPFLDQNEMANTPVGPYPPQAGGYSPMVAEKAQTRPYSNLFKKVYGTNVFETNTTEQIYGLITSAIASYEASREINPFSSAFDASPFGTPPRRLYKLTKAQENGMVLFFSDAQCFQCHSSSTLDLVLQNTRGKDTFTMYCYANIGVPANPDNPYYSETNCDSDPEGCNPQGAGFIDYGLGENPNPGTDGTIFYTNTPGDNPAFRGLFKAPSLRNANKRPSPEFVKSFMHNGVFKSLQDVVHFYNKRNVAVDTNGVETAFDLRVGPPPGFTPLFAPPEVLDNVQNVAGVPPAYAGSTVADNGQVGNLGLSAEQEADIVSFLEILTDGFITPASD